MADLFQQTTRIYQIGVHQGVNDFLGFVHDTHFVQEIGFTHMRILEGVGTIIQLGGLLARLCKLVCPTASRGLERLLM